MTSASFYIVAARIPILHHVPLLVICFCSAAGVIFGLELDTSAIPGGLIKVRETKPYTISPKT